MTRLTRPPKPDITGIPLAAYTAPSFNWMTFLSGVCSGVVGLGALLAFLAVL